MPKPVCAESKQFGGNRYCFYRKGTTYALNAIFKRYEWNDFEIRYQYREDHAQENAIEAARRSDVALVFLGFSETLEGEGHDRTPDLPEDQLALLRSILAVNRNVVVILNTGSGLSMDPWSHDVPAIVEAYYPGQEEGTAIADILFGDVNPSGKLPFTCMKRWEDSPVYGHYPEGADEVLPYVEGIYVGYRYFDRPDAPQAAFPFGHGLSYTTFTYSNLSISSRTTETGEISATVQVRNSGGRAGAEVVQLYIGADHSSVDETGEGTQGISERCFLAQAKAPQFSSQSVVATWSSTIYSATIGKQNPVRSRSISAHRRAIFVRSENSPWLIDPSANAAQDG